MIHIFDNLEMKCFKSALEKFKIFKKLKFGHWFYPLPRGLILASGTPFLLFSRLWNEIIKCQSNLFLLCLNNLPLFFTVFWVFNNLSYFNLNQWSLSRVDSSQYLCFPPPNKLQSIYWFIVEDFNHKTIKFLSTSIKMNDFEVQKIYVGFVAQMKNRKGVYMFCEIIHRTVI